jgi:selenocysteine-specific elongation factor
LALLDKSQRSNRLRAGDACLARLLLDEPVAACRNDRFLLRDHAEAVTLGGGRVLDPFVPPGRKLDSDRLAVLQALQLQDPEESLAALLASGEVLDWEKVRLTYNLSEEEFQRTLPTDAKPFSARDRKWLVQDSGWTAGMSTLQASVAGWHRENPSEAGMPVGVLKEVLAKDMDSPLLLALVTAAIETRQMLLKNGLVSEPGFRVVASPEAQGGWEKLEYQFQRAGRQIPLVTELAENTGMDKTRLDELLAELERMGYLRRISSKRFAPPRILQDFANEILAMDGAGEQVTVIGARDRFGVGRNLAIEVLEFFDRVRFTRRVGDVRIIQDAGVPAAGFKR